MAPVHSLKPKDQCAFIGRRAKKQNLNLIPRQQERACGPGPRLTSRVLDLCHFLGLDHFSGPLRNVLGKMGAQLQLLTLHYPITQPRSPSSALLPFFSGGGFPH